MRPCTSNDMKHILSIESESFAEGERYSRSIFLYYIMFKKAILLVASIDNNIVGYSLGYMEDEEVGHIVSIAVKKAYRNNGIGTKLMESIENELKSRGAKLIKLEVSVDNNARKLYEKLGYKMIKLLPMYYGNRDGILMIKEFT
ncbi:ribosomal protein S18-alanine N-acetyltransferase [Caldisphaera lagunensis]|uniref:ribosomal protein S18-alanine N-acetyltransferase n=1 Tax=Caldisphaera lagunensis TaxID=200415 RepID=UPI0024809E4C|nr:ribosomal protein S18-alanine N-acetyltransferase [Caldisphaera lagunensis]